MTGIIIEWNDSLDNDYIEADNIDAMALIFKDDANVSLDGSFSINELEQIISKMKELQKDLQNN
jgi:hypothetical protein